MQELGFGNVWQVLVFRAAPRPGSPAESQALGDAASVRHERTLPYAEQSLGYELICGDRKRLCFEGYHVGVSFFESMLFFNDHTGKPKSKLLVLLFLFFSFLWGGVQTHLCVPLLERGDYMENTHVGGSHTFGCWQCVEHSRKPCKRYP